MMFIMIIVIDMESCENEEGSPTLKMSLIIDLSNLKSLNLNDMYVSLLKSSQFSMMIDVIASDITVAQAAPAIPMSRT